MDKYSNDHVDKSLLFNEDSETNKSFVKKVTSRVSGLLPSSLSKWFGGNETVSQTRNRDDLDEDDEEEFVIQPPTKRQRKLSGNSQHTDNHVPSNYYQHVNNGTYREPVPGPSNCNKTTYLTTVVHSNKPDKGDKESDSTESSGYSSVIKNRNELFNTPPKEKSEDRHGTSFFLNSTPRSERSLFLDRISSPSDTNNTSLSSRRPAFNASTFARADQPSAIAKSPFYKGRTMYGGASAYNKLKYFNTPESKVSCRNTVQITPSKESKTTDKTSLSKTAQRILETLEQYTSPLAESKKMPLPTLRRSTARDSIMNNHAHPYMSKEKPTHRELQVPTVPELLKMKLKEKLQDSTVSVRELANTSKSVLNRREYTIKTNEDNLSKHTNKMKTKITSTRSTNSTKQANEHLEEVELPNVQLPITTLPKFDFNFSSPLNSDTCKENHKSTTDKPESKSKSPSVDASALNDGLKSKNKTAPPTHVPTNRTKPDVSTKETTAGPINAEYNFSEPIVIATNMKYIKAINDFKFSEPISKKIEETLSKAASQVKRNGDNTPQIQPVKELLTTGSVMDVLGKNDLVEKFKPAEGTWECTTCLIRNKADDDRCVACTSKRATDQKRDACVDLNKFKLTADKWECAACMVRNNSTDTKCVACTTPRPVVNGSLVCTKSPAKTASDLASLFKPPANTWACGVCMIRNKSEADKCAACETPKPQTSSNVAKKTDLASMFKPPSDTWECDVCLVRNKSDADKCVACTVQRPASKLDDFKMKRNQWECQVCLVPNTNDKDTCVCCESGRQDLSGGTAKADTGSLSGTGLNFGVPTTFSFGIASPANKPAESTSELAKGFTFGVPATATPMTTAATATTTTSKETPTFTFGVPNNADKETPSKGFVFGVQGENKSSEETEKADGTKITFGTSLKPTESTNNMEPRPPTLAFGTAQNKETDKTNETKDAENNKQNNGAATFKFGVAVANPQSVSVGVKRTASDSETPAKRKSDVRENATESKQAFFDKPKADEPRKDATFAFGSNATTSIFGTNKGSAITFGSKDSFPATAAASGKETAAAKEPIFGTTTTSAIASGSSKNVPVFGAAKSIPVNNESSVFGTTSKGNAVFGSTQSSSIFGSTATPTADTSKNALSASKHNFNVNESNVFGAAASTMAATPSTFGSKSVPTPASTTFGFKENAPTFGSKNPITTTAVTFASKGNATPPSFGAKTSTTFGKTNDAAVFGKTTFTTRQNFPFSPATTTQSSSNLFNSATGQTSLPFTFAANANKTSAAPTEAAKSSTTSIFGASNANVLGATNQARGAAEAKATPANMFSFSNPKPAENSTAAPNNNASNSSSNLFTFGSTAAGIGGASNKTAGFSFSQSSNSETQPKSLFNITPQQQQQLNNPFDGGNTANGGFTFTQTKTPKTGFNFGNSTIAPTPTANTQQQQQQPGIFSFGSSSAAENQQNAPQPAATGGFNFGSANAPQFNAPAQPAFNFTGGSATPTFTATGPPAEKSHRVMRKALRRTQR